MILSLEALSKTIGAKKLFENASFTVNKSQKVAIIGRNGVGKSTLFNIIAGYDKDYSGTLEKSKSLKVIKTEQEHFFPVDLSPLEYILSSIPEYVALSKAIKDYEDDPSTDNASIEKFSSSIESFHKLGFENIEVDILNELNGFGIDIDKVFGSFSSLSGGEKRFVEIVRVATFTKFNVNDTLVLFDEPTNHLDYIGKARFISWLQNYTQTCIIITHDRDVLNVVDKIIELTQTTTSEFLGNYSKYISQNTISNVTAINAYKVDLDNVARLKKLYLNFKEIKNNTFNEPAKSSAAKKEQKFFEEYELAKKTLKKPAFWIDQESLDNIDLDIQESYHNFKKKNINFNSVVKHNAEDIFIKDKTEIIIFENLSLGFNSAKPLFQNLNLKFFIGQRLEIRGRNGAGKSTLIKELLAEQGKKLSDFQTTILDGRIYIDERLRFGVYEQEINASYLDYSIKDYIFEIYKSNHIVFNDQEFIRVLANYLFDPVTDRELLVRNCSGGQKARLQIIKMLMNNPNILILDEPTNHLDLPSIEELEKLLVDFPGSIIYISHDNFFRKNIGGKILEIK